MVKSFPFVVFDFDGTLVESAIGMTTCINQMLGELDRPALEVNEVEAMVGEGINVTIEKAMRKTGTVPQDLSKYVDRFKTLYYQQPVKETPLYPNALSTLEKLTSNGHVVALCTNKAYDATVRLCKGLNIAHFFTAIAGGDTYSVRKPNPEHLLRVLNEIGGTTDRAVMIGDSINDIACANAAQVCSIAVTYGYTKTPPNKLGATYLVDGLDEIPDALVNLASQ